MEIAMVGGTGRLGSALALRLARAGYPVIVGSRDAARARQAAAELAQRSGGEVRGADNREAAAAAEVVFVTVPSAAHPETLRGLHGLVDGKVVVDCTVYLDPADPTRWAPPPEGSAALRARAVLPEARVVSAFHTLSAKALAGPAQRGAGEPAADGLVAGDDPEAKATVMRLGEACGLRCVDCGDLGHAAVLEHLTPLLIGLNRRYRRSSAGIRVTGLVS
jgi:NADPH-dependent F420 reductase